MWTDSQLASAASAVAKSRSWRGVKPDIKHLREAGTSIASMWFLLCGYNTSFPVEPTIYDLLVSMPDGIKTVQVKTTTCKTDGWVVQVGRRPYSVGNRARGDLAAGAGQLGDPLLVDVHVGLGRTARHQLRAGRRRSGTLRARPIVWVSGWLGQNLTHPANARAREIHVVGRLVATGKLTQAQGNAALAVPLSSLIAGAGQDCSS
jgi:hypothetical protein